MHGVGVEDIVTSGSAIAGEGERRRERAVELLFGTRTFAAVQGGIVCLRGLDFVSSFDPGTWKEHRVPTAFKRQARH